MKPSRRDLDTSALPSVNDAEQLDRYHRLYALRSEIAGFSSRYAAERVAHGDSPAEVQQSLRRMREAATKQDFEGFLTADMEFHRSIVVLADTPALLTVWDTIIAEMLPFVSWVQRTLYTDLLIVVETHESYGQAIVEGKPELAEYLARIDFDSLWQMLLEQPTGAADEEDPVERVCAYVLLNLHRRLTLEQIARDVAHLSPSHLAKLFREYRKESFSDYVQRLRIRRAANLLRYTQNSVVEIAARVGYLDASRFILHFRRVYELSPAEWRQQNGLPENKLIHASKGVNGRTR